MSLDIHWLQTSEPDDHELDKVGTKVDEESLLTRIRSGLSFQDSVLQFPVEHSPLLSVEFHGLFYIKSSGILIC